MNVYRTNLLTLRGVRKSDYDKPAPVVTNTIASVVYPEIPAKFTSADEWSKLRTTLLCWECSLAPVSYPKFIPTDMCGDDSCRPHGNFCEWTCVASYVRANYGREKIADILTTVSHYECKFSGKYRQRIPNAEPKTRMKQYCGEIGLTQAEFREKNAAIYRDSELTTFKMEHLSGFSQKGSK